MDNLGSYLKSQREERGIALEEIASITKIHVRSLEMIEHSQWKSLPPEPFIRGFLSAYSRYVGLDPKDVLEKYQLETHPLPVVAPVTAVETVVVVAPPPVKTVHSEIAPNELEEKTLAYEIPKKNHQWKIWTAATVAAAILIVVPILLRDKSTTVTASAPTVKEESKAKTEEDDTAKRESVQSLVSKAIPATPEAVAEKPKEVAAPVAEEKRKVAAVTTTAPVAAPAVDEKRTVATATAPVAATAVTEAAHSTSPSAAPTGAHVLVVKVKDKSWSKLVVDGKPPVQKILNADETYTYAADEKIKLVLGNSAGAEILHNGEKVDGLKIDGTIRQFVFPNNSRFPQDPPKRKVATPEKEAENSPVNTDSGLPKTEN